MLRDNCDSAAEVESLKVKYIYGFFLSKIQKALNVF